MTLRAADLMTTPVITAQADQTVAAVAATMHQHRLSFVPVTEKTGGTVLGILSAADILHLEAARQDTERLAGLRLQAAGGRCRYAGHRRGAADVGAAGASRGGNAPA